MNLFRRTCTQIERFHILLLLLILRCLDVSPTTRLTIITSHRVVQTTESYNTDPRGSFTHVQSSCRCAALRDCHSIILYAFRLFSGRIHCNTDTGISYDRFYETRVHTLLAENRLTRRRVQHNGQNVTVSGERVAVHPGEQVANGFHRCRIRCGLPRRVPTSRRLTKTGSESLEDRRKVNSVNMRTQRAPYPRPLDV